MNYTTVPARLAGLAARRPSLLPALIRAAWRFRRRNWWKRPPFVPLPPTDYVGWRLHTAYGGADRLPDGGELVRYLRWSDWMSRTRFHA